MGHFRRVNGSHSRYGILTYHTLLSDPVKGFEKKLHLPLGWWSFYVIRLKQVWAIAISFSGQKEFLPPWGYSPSPEAMESWTPNLSVRDQITSRFTSRPLVLSVQWELNCSKSPQKTQFKTPARAWRVRSFQPRVMYWKNSRKSILNFEHSKYRSKLGSNTYFRNTRISWSRDMTQSTAENRYSQHIFCLVW